MRTQDYVPHSDGKKLTWAANIAENIDVTGPAISLLTAAEITEIKSSSNAIELSVKKKEPAKATAKSVNDEENAKIAVSIKVLRRNAQAIKSTKNYTEAIGKQLGIVVVDTELDVDNLNPHLIARQVNDHVRIEFSKKGIDGARVYSRKKGETHWTFLATDHYSPYNDARPLAVEGVPETREYMCKALIHDEVVGWIVT